MHPIQGIILKSSRLFFARKPTDAASEPRSSESSQFGNRARDLIALSRLDTDIDFLQPLLGLHHSLQSAGDLALDPDSSGSVALPQGFTAVGAPYDQAHHSINRLNLLDESTALFGSGLMSSARRHVRLWVSGILPHVQALQN